MPEATVFSFGGHRLHVDLSTGAVNRERTDAALAQAYLGGRGLNVKWLHDHLAPHTDPLSPQNVLVFGAGPLVGTSFPGGARFNISAMSPQTGILGDSNAGGFFGPEMKFAGYDQIVVEGRAERPVYILVEDDHVELRAADHLWGLDVHASTAAMEQAAGERAQVATVGQAAENGVRFAGVFVNRHRAAARTGMGTVMASKNLKAIAVRGTGAVQVADFETFTTLIARLDERIARHAEYDERARLGTTRLVKSLERIGALPTHHLSGEPFDGADAVSGETIAARYRVKGKACFGCTIPCSRFLRVDDPRFPGLQIEGPEYEPLAGFTARVGNSDLPLALHCIDQTTRYGMDAIAVTEAIAWAMECHARGLLSQQEAGGLDLSWGNGDAIVSLVHQVARREGLGDLLADGVRRASERLGRGSEAFALHSKGLELFQADVRTIKAYALGNAVSSRGADHLRSEPWFEFSNDAAEGVRASG
jgi:aldehyde:ferredoxin oxidoreductase